VRTFEDQPLGLWSAAFSRDGRFLLTASDLPVLGARRNAVVLRDAASGRALARLPGHRDHPRAVAFSPDTRYAMSADRGGAVYLWTLNL
jgi:WD40 repeat protein